MSLSYFSINLSHLCFVYFQNRIMTTREPIDYLLDLIATQAESDNNSARTTQGTPERLTTLRIKNLSTSSLKKRQKKSTNCRYCAKFKFSREQIESHLAEYETCYLLYLREEKVRDINGILLKLFRCISCGAQGKFQLKKHLGENGKCLKFYQERFQAENWNEIKTIMFNLLRSSYASRSSVKRRLEYSYPKKKDSITVIQALNKFRKDVSLANYRLCVSCDQFFLESGKKLRV